jgi:hypothetical protein
VEFAPFDALKADGFVDEQNLVDDHGFGLRSDELAQHAAAPPSRERGNLISPRNQPCRIGSPGPATGATNAL